MRPTLGRLPTPTSAGTSRLWKTSNAPAGASASLATAHFDLVLGVDVLNDGLRRIVEALNSIAMPGAWRDVGGSPTSQVAHGATDPSGDRAGRFRFAIWSAGSGMVAVIPGTGAASDARREEWALSPVPGPVSSGADPARSGAPTHGRAGPAASPSHRTCRSRQPRPSVGPGRRRVGGSCWSTRPENENAPRLVARGAGQVTCIAGHGPVSLPNPFYVHRLEGGPHRSQRIVRIAQQFGLAQHESV